MKVLRLPAYTYPEQVAGTHLINDLNSAYQKDGTIKMLEYAPTPTRGIDDATFEKYKKIYHEFFYDGVVEVVRFPLRREGKNTISRAFRYLMCNLKQYNRGVRAKDIDLVMCSSTPPTQGMLCAKVAKKLSKKYGRKVPFLFTLQDIFPDSLVNAKMTKKGSIIWKIGRKIEDYTYRNADKIIVISEDFKRNIMEKGVPEDKIVIIPNWVNTENVYSVPREENVLFERYGLDPSKYYVTYSGNIGHSQNMNMLLEAAKQLADELPDLVFVLIGEGAAVEDVKAAIEKDGITNVVMLPFQPYEEISHVFSLGDAGLIISKSGIGGSSVPSKTFSIMAAERPVLASFDDTSALSALIRESGCGVTSQANDIEAFKAAIRELYSDRAAASEMGKRGRAYLFENLDKDKCVGAYVETIKSVASLH